MKIGTSYLLFLWRKNGCFNLFIYFCSMKPSGLYLVLLFTTLIFLPQCGYSERLLSIDEIDRLYVKDADKALTQIQRLGAYCEKTQWKTCRRSKYYIVYSCICMYKQMAPENLHYAYSALENAILEKDTSYQLMALQFIADIYINQGDYFKFGQYIQQMLNLANDDPRWTFFRAQSKDYQSDVALKSQRPLAVVFKYLDEENACYTGAQSGNPQKYLIRWSVLQKKSVALLERKRYKEAYTYLRKTEAYLKKLIYLSKVKKVDVYMDDAAFQIRMMETHALLCLPLYQLGRKKEAEDYFALAMNKQESFRYDFITELALVNYLEQSQQWEHLTSYLDKYVDYNGKNRNTLLLMKKGLNAYMHLNNRDGEKSMIRLISNLSDTITLRNDMYAEEEVQAVGKIGKMASTILSQRKNIDDRMFAIKLYVALSLVLGITIVVAVFIIFAQRKNNIILFKQIKEKNRSMSQLELVLPSGDEHPSAIRKNLSTMETDNMYCKKDYQDFVNSVKAYIEIGNKYADSSLTPDIVAEHFDVSRQFLDREMKEFVGVTVYDFITEMRLLHSCNLLENTNDIIYAVAINSGFGSERTYLRIFKQKYNMSPTMYRKISKEKKSPADKK